MKWLEKLKKWWREFNQNYCRAGKHAVDEMDRPCRFCVDEMIREWEASPAGEEWAEQRNK